MDKQKIIAGINPKKRKTNRKDAAAKIREQSFNEAYQKSKDEEQPSIETQPAPKVQVLKEEPAKAEEVQDEKSVDNTIMQSEEDQTNAFTDEESETVPQKTAAKKPTKKGKKKEGVGEITYATISVHQNVSKVVKLASTLLEANKLDFTTDAVRHYIKYLKKSGKLPDMSSLDI